MVLSRPIPGPRFRSGTDLVTRLQERTPLLTVELRPPRRSPQAGTSRELWIDLYHAVRQLTREDTLVFTTDSAVGAAEEEGLRHLSANLGGDADLSRVLPFLTSKHSLEYCLRFPERAFSAGHRGMTVLGGDAHAGPPRCVPHAVELRRLLRARNPHVALGGWANPYRDPVWQVDLLKQEEGVTDFFLTQVVSHHDLPLVERLLAEIDRQRLTIPGLFGVFYYRSANPRTLQTLRGFLPVPVAGLLADFAAGLSPDDICQRTLVELHALGIHRYYLCNLPAPDAPRQLRQFRSALT